MGIHEVERQALEGFFDDVFRCVQENVPKKETPQINIPPKNIFAQLIFQERKF